MITRLLLLLLLLSPGPAEAGIRAVYSGSMRPAIEVAVADNGDFDIVEGRRRLVQRNGALYLIEERLTGPLVDRYEDLAALGAANFHHARAVADLPALVSRGTATIAALVGEAFDYSRPKERGGADDRPLLVLSTDPELRPLAAALRRLWQVEHLQFTLANPGADHELWSDQPGVLQLIEGRAPLRFGDMELAELHRGEVRLAPFGLAAQAETREALRLRLEKEARGDEPSENSNVLRALFADERLWLLTDDGKLTSLAPGDRSRRAESPGGAVIDICSGAGGLRALTGERSGGRSSTLRRWSGGRWTVEREVDGRGEALVALSCAGKSALLLTSKRLIAVGSAGEESLRLSGDLRLPRVKPVTLESEDYLFVGLNSGEWGGGLMRIDRRSGRVETIERNATGDRCEGPLSTACDPVHGLAPIPWKPSCIAAAIGLIHFLSHGRIVEICGKQVETLFVQAADPYQKDPKTAASVAAGRYGAIAFFGLAAAGDSLLAAGQDGLYRIGAGGVSTRQSWPRFEAVDGLLVSFALPDAVLVVTTINRRASVSGGAPLLVPR
ncbi:MAG TPA: hypothetical protein VF574_03085 [Allosphingosinicella sp.]|jgi:hypothetical protein